MSKRHFHAYFLVGLPGRGQSVFRALLEKFQGHKAWHVFSADDLVKKIAQDREVDFISIYQDEIEAAVQKVRASEERMANQRRNLIWEMPDLLTREQRAERLKLLTPDYHRVAITFPTDGYWHNQLKELGFSGSLDHLKSIYEPPTLDEGFHEVREQTA
jgi:hypothetical protein